MQRSEVLILEDSPIRNLRMRLTQNTVGNSGALMISVYNHYQDERPESIATIALQVSGEIVQSIAYTSKQGQVAKRQHIVDLPDDEDGIMDYGMLRSRIRVGQPLPRRFTAFLARREWKEV